MGEPMRVLVVDDNDDTRELFADLLRARGYATELAHDAASALAIAIARPPDAAILDIGLPGVDGYELARQLRVLPGLAQLRIIAVTGHSGDAHRRSASEAGIDRHLIKPIRIVDLLAELPPRASAAPD